MKSLFMSLFPYLFVGAIVATQVDRAFSDDTKKGPKEKAKDTKTAEKGIDLTMLPDIVVSSSRTGTANLYLIHLGTGTVKNLTPGTAAAGYPCFSRDGKKIAFSLTRDGNSNIYVMDADGKNIKQLTTQKGCKSPTWSPDGKRIAYQQGTDLMIMDADGKNPKSVHSNGFDPIWSPDGKRFAIGIGTSMGFKVGVVNADGSRFEQFNSKDNRIGGVYPCWSPDSKKIAYADDVGGGLEIFTCDATGKNFHQLTKLGGTNLYPSWSPDGDLICFQHKQGGRVTFHLTTAEGSTVVPLAVLKDENSVDGPITWRFTN